jgi:hypothetical protein
VTTDHSNIYGAMSTKTFTFCCDCTDSHEYFAEPR